MEVLRGAVTQADQTLMTAPSPPGNCSASSTTSDAVKDDVQDMYHLFKLQQGNVVEHRWERLQGYGEPDPNLEKDGIYSSGMN
ncbi:hypothetical protein VKT23_004706 [Stygiomarasmius scandens]|uniref:Uncharacterized protein n=1 Tax=Marasmiellus scandens TaxID=2682957 RepID=A0ABR1JWE3_9AGAR